MINQILNFQQLDDVIKLLNNTHLEVNLGDLRVRCSCGWVITWRHLAKARLCTERAFTSIPFLNSIFV